MAKRQRIKRVIPRRILSSTIGLLLILSASICVIVFTTFSRELFRMRHDLGLSMIRALRRQVDYPTFLNLAALQRVLRSYAGTAHVDEILVVGTDRLTTPAGSFDCYLVRRRSKSPDDSWRGEQLSWYDPVLGWIVKFEAFDSTGRSQRWQLVDYD